MMIHCNNCHSLFTPNYKTNNFCSLSCSSSYNRKLEKQKNIEKYLLNPKHCKECGSIFPYEKKNHNTFCSRSCAATYNNERKDWSKIKTGPVPKFKKIDKVRKKRTNILLNADGPHTKIYLCTCKFTGIKWYSPTVKTIHPSVVTTKQMYSYQCRFTFSIRTYAEWFSYAETLIKSNGWYSASNKGNNLSGCSRDHLLSVSDGYKNKIDPKIISHPANCEIVPHRKNQSKNKKSTISLVELQKRIKEFNLKYLEMPDGVEPSSEVLQTST